MEILVFPLLALLIAVVIVWWTMFSGRPKNEPPQDPSEGEDGGGNGKHTR